MRAVCLAILLPLLLQAEAVNLSGTWQLNVKRSEWGSKPRPNKVVLNIQHNEPKYKYDGNVEDADGHITTFSFDGATDGKEYPIKDGAATNKAAVRRLSDQVISTQVRYADGVTEEFSTTRLSDDGKTLIRSIRLKSPQGNARWREYYERVQ